MAIKDKKLLPVAELDRGFVHPKPEQVVVSYFQAGRICDYITDKWGWDTLLAMLHDFGQRRGHRRGDPQGTEDGAGGIRQAVSGARSKPTPRTWWTTSTNGRRA